MTQAQFNVEYPSPWDTSKYFFSSMVDENKTVNYARWQRNNIENTKFTNPGNNPGIVTLLCEGIIIWYFWQRRQYTIYLFY